MNHFEVKYWDKRGALMAVEVIAFDWREAERMVAELGEHSVEGSVLLGSTSMEPGVRERTTILLREARPE